MTTLLVKNTPRPVQIDPDLADELNKYTWFYHNGRIYSSINPLKTKRSFNFRLEHLLFDISPARRTKFLHSRGDRFDHRKESVFITKDKYINVTQGPDKFWYAQFNNLSHGPCSEAHSAAELYDSIILSLQILPINYQLNFLHNYGIPKICKTSY